MKQFWNQRYAEHAFVYGEQPNAFFKSFIDTHKPGSLLLPAEGEGRNAIYAAKQGWQVDAFDYSEVAREKALARAREEGVTIHYIQQELSTYTPEKLYDVVALIYVHMSEPLRVKFHAAVAASLKSGGFLVLEAFSKDQLHHSSGGPKDESMLYDASTLYHDFHLHLNVLSCEQMDIVLDEGDFHKGQAAVVRLVAQNL